MTRVRISTTVDPDLLRQAQELEPGRNLAALVDAALVAYLASNRRAEIDASYALAYSRHPSDEPDEWGSLDAFHEAARHARRPA